MHILDFNIQLVVLIRCVTDLRVGELPFRLSLSLVNTMSVVLMLAFVTAASYTLVSMPVTRLISAAICLASAASGAPLEAREMMVTSSPSALI